jgi:acyl-CoA reductase-like NAD-dependent aldehyde dehydrogenase
MSTEKLQNFIDGEWVDSHAQEYVEIRNPAWDELLATAPMSTPTEVNDAVAAAQDAYASWRNTPPVARARYLHRLVPLLEDNFDVLSICQTKEHGKTIDESRGETRRGIEMVEVANNLMEHPLIQGVTFVGSTLVGKQIYRKCGEEGKRVIAQAGAKNFVVVMPDAEIEQTLVSLITSFYGNTGQRCLSGANLLIVGDDNFYREFVDKFVDMATNIRVGDGLE